MAIKQLTVFVQNKKGTVASVTDILSKSNINLRALSIAETQDFGILRIIVNDEETAGAIFESLLMTGIAMSFHKSSRPASGSEHIIAHLIECLQGNEK